MSYFQSWLLANSNGSRNDYSADDDRFSCVGYGISLCIVLYYTYYIISNHAVPYNTISYYK